MYCPKCSKENLDNADVCFFCGQELPANQSIYIALEKDKVFKWRPKYVDIHVPDNQGTVRVSFLKPPFVEGNKLRIRHRGVDGRVSKISEISNHKIKEMIKDIIGVIEEMA